MSTDDTCIAEVEKVEKGVHGLFAIAWPDDSDQRKKLGSITFLLKEPVWTESDQPTPGMMVVLTQLRSVRRKWRANRARFMKPSDQTQPVVRKEK